MEPKLTLSDIRPGEGARIVRVGGAGSFRRRLLELGLLPGTVVQRVGAAPLGDPLSFKVRGAVLSLRNAEAQLISAERLS